MTSASADKNSPVVIIGAGQAGFSTGAKLRELGHTGPVTLIGEEEHLPYQRPPLSKGYLLGEVTEDRLLLRPRPFYDERDITLRLGTAAVEIDRDSRQVRLADGTVLPYGHLVLATGSRPRRLSREQGGDLDGLYAVRAIADILRMVPEVKPGRRMLVVGGGYIGLEAAAVCAKLGLSVTLIESAPRILQRVAAPETADFFRDLHRGHGVDIREGVGLVALTGEGGRVSEAHLSDGHTLPVDFVIVGIGIEPNTALASAAGLTIDNGIAVDEHCRTSDPAILAVGDCASFPWKGRRIRLESVGNAVAQGEAAAHTILGETDGYAVKPWFWSDQFDVKLQIAGLNLGYDATVVRPVSENSLSVWYYRGNELLAVDAINQSGVYMLARRLIEAGRSPEPAYVADPASDLKALLRS